MRLHWRYIKKAREQIAMRGKSLKQKNEQLEQQISTAVLAVFNKNLASLLLYNTSDLFIESWIKLSFNLGFYCFMNSSNYSLTSTNIAEQIETSVELICQTYLDYSLRRISLPSFSTGSFVLTVLFGALASNRLLLVDLVRAQIRAYGLTPDKGELELDSLQFSKLKQMLESGAVFGNNVVKLAMLFVDINLSRKQFTELLSYILPEEYQSLTFLLTQEQSAAG